MAARRVTTPLWWLRSEDDEAVTLHAVGSDERRDGAVVDVVSLPPGTAPRGPRVVRARMHRATRQMLSVEVAALPGSVAPPMVLHEVVRRDLRPVEVHLIAFLHEDVVRLAGARRLAVVPPGTVLTAADVRRLTLTDRDQLAAVRWNPATGQALEVYVDPGYRRRRVGTGLLVSAEACAVARGWPTLWGGGLRTALGENLVRGLAWGTAPRVRPLTAIAPPMTPPGEEEGRLVARPRVEPGRG